VATVEHSAGGGGGGGGGESDSTVQAFAAGVASTFRAGSIARTENWWDPRARPVYAVGEVQLVQAEPSRVHSKVEPASSEEKLKLAAVDVVLEAGPLVIEVCGVVVSGGGGGGGVVASSTVQF
jgi:hypothetical protein